MKAAINLYRKLGYYEVPVDQLKYARCDIKMEIPLSNTFSKDMLEVWKKRFSEGPDLLENTLSKIPKEIYNWLRNEIVDGCKASRPEDDFESIEIIQKLFSVEINRFKKGVGTLYEQQQGVYQIKLGEHIERIQADFHAVANAYVRFTCSERGKLLSRMLLILS